MNKTIDTNDHEEYARVVQGISKKDFDKARNELERNPQLFYNQLVVLLWNAEDWEICGTDFEPHSIQRDIFDTIQGIAVRDKNSRNFRSLCELISSQHPDLNRQEVLEAASTARRIKQDGIN